MLFRSDTCEKSGDQNTSTESISLKLAKVVSSDPIYGDIINKLKNSYENILAENIIDMNEAANTKIKTIKEELVKEKLRGDKLEAENISLTKEYEKQCEIIASQRTKIKELETKFISNSKESLLTEMKKLYQENEKLENINRKQIGRASCRERVASPG